jgi:FAS-associated factor 2
MAVLSRHEGSPASATSATLLIDHIQNLLLPRVTPYLQRLQREKDRRQRERELREEQDRAFERAAAADAERVRTAREEDRLRREADRRKVEEARREEEGRQKHLLWRRWARKYHVPSEPSSGEEGRVKIAVRLPSGKRLERFFSKDTKIERLFAYVETAEREGDEDFDDEDDVPLAAPTDFKVQYRFNLISGYPRAKIEPSALTLDQTIADVEAVRGGGSFIAEGQVGVLVSRTIDTTDEDTDH